MKVFDPFTVSEDLRKTFLRYLAEAHPIHQSEALLRRKFEEALFATDRFVREPLVTAIPSYAHAQTPEELFTASSPPRLSPQLRSLNPDELDPRRPLYNHQVRAIQAIQSGKNVVVATGTGSGKTECFLLPIVDDAARATEPGIVAIVIYPMNALAEDQLRRLRSLLRGTGITFGRYTGQTKGTRKEVSEQEWNEAAHPNELVTREQIRESPPHILLTNFAMLEYLLLRPQDQVIFRHQTVKYVVLDEAHTYSGAQGIDVSLLMRRLQLQYQHKLQFVLTSATMGGSAEKIATFAAGLTGSSFDASSVVFGEASNPFEGAEALPLADDVIGRLADHADPTGLFEAAGSQDRMAAWLESCGLTRHKSASPTGALFAALRERAPMRRLYEELRSAPRAVSDLAQTIFASGHKDDGLETEKAATKALCAAASIARPDYPHASPLMSVRVHHFFRGLNGAAVALEPGLDDRGRVKDVVLEDSPATEDGVRLLSLRTCVHCGMPVAVIRMRDADTWEKPTGKSSQPLRLLTWFPIDGAEEDEDSGDHQAAYARVCLECGRYGDGDLPPCTCAKTVKLRLLTQANPDGTLHTCPCCGGDKGQYDSVLRDFVTGEDAPTALLAEEIIRQLPEQDHNCPAAGRRLLAFSDSRQRAAYFMPYLTRTAAEPSYVQPILAAAAQIERDEKRSGTVVEVIDRALSIMLGQDWVVFRQTDQSDMFDRYQIRRSAELSPDERRSLRHEIALSVYQNITASSRQRTKFIGLKLASPTIELTHDEIARAKRRVPELFADERIGIDALQRLLMTLVRRGAVQFVPSSVTYRHFVTGAPALVTVHRDPSGPVQGRRRVRWNPYEAAPARRNQAVRVSRTARIVRDALRSDDAAAIAHVLDGIWDWMIEHNAILRPTNDPGEYLLPAGRILVRTGGPWWVCDRCGAPTIHPLTGTCEIYGCGGKLSPVDPDRLAQEQAVSHRAARFLRDPLPLVVREHTAQLEPEQGRRYQDEFNKCLVNVLSCSTTFEMGVDVGTLEAVLLRNVPPTPANYIQRAGRAGRRKQGVAHAVTYARTVPHDQHHYFRPHDIVNGTVPVPVIYGGNVRLTQRHVNSFLLGRFLRDHRQQFQADNATVTDFFPDPEGSGGQNSPAETFAAWVQQHKPRLMAEVDQIIPPTCPLKPGDAMARAAQSLYSDNPEDRQTAYYRGLVSPLNSYSGEAQQLQEEIMRALTEKQTRRVAGLAHAKDRIDRLKQQIREQRLIDFLAGLNWLPSYAFPQDVVKLTVRQATDRGIMRLERDRELGISEYSPSSQVIADGKLLESVGINLEWREPELKYYRFSQANRRIFIGNTVQEVLDASANVPMRPIQFLEPLGFTTMWDAPIEQPNLFRLRPPSNTEVFLVDGAEAFEVHTDVPGVKTGIRSDAKLFRGNMGKGGKGFRLCLRCGIDQDSAGSHGGAHKTPWGSECRGQFQPVALAHIFHTDVLQVRFDGFPPVSEASFWLTLATAFTNAACELLSIDPKDLDSTYRSQSDADVHGELVIFDRVPGGAGHVEQIRRRLRDVLNATIERLRKCRNPDCAEDSSCYACLRSHRNQFQWASLKRSAPLPWLEQIATFRP